MYFHRLQNVQICPALLQAVTGKDTPFCPHTAWAEVFSMPLVSHQQMLDLIASALNVSC